MSIDPEQSHWFSRELEPAGFAVGHYLARQRQRPEFELLTRAIQALPTRCRQVMTLRTAFGLSQKEISVRLGLSEDVVEMQLADGVRRCSAYFGRLKAT